MQRWEYLVEIVRADISNTGWEEYLSAHPMSVAVPKFTPETMIPHLSRRGAEGWEVVHMEPVRLRDSGVIALGDIDFPMWVNTYFCAFKRPRPDQN